MKTLNICSLPNWLEWFVLARFFLVPEQLTLNIFDAKYSLLYLRGLPCIIKKRKRNRKRWNNKSEDPVRALGLFCIIVFISFPGYFCRGQIFLFSLFPSFFKVVESILMRRWYCWYAAICSLFTVLDCCPPTSM